jgi:drug/metabolite transporter (DMT)-like permease
MIRRAIERSSNVLGLGAVVASVMLFAVSLSVIKWPGIPGSAIAWWRLVGSSVLWWAFLIGRRRRTGAPLPSRATLRLVAPAGLCFGVNISLQFLGLTKTSIAHGDFIGSMAPLLLVPAGFVFFHERPRWRALGWGLISVTGLTIILTNGPTRGVATVRGDVIVAAAVVMLSVYQLLSKRIRAIGVHPWEFMAIVMPVALITATPVAVVSAGGALWPLSWKAWTSVAILSVMTGMVGHVLLYYSQRHVPIATISMIQTSQPAQSTFWAWLLLGETITVRQLPGMALVIIGLSLVVWFSQRRRPGADLGRAGDESSSRCRPDM